MKHIEVTDNNFVETIKEGIILVNFWAHWSGPCRTIDPIIEELADEYEGKVKICKLNTDEEQMITQQEEIRSIPTIKFYKNNECVETVVGAQSKQNLKEVLDILIGK